MAYGFGDVVASGDVPAMVLWHEKSGETELTGCFEIVTPSEAHRPAVLRLAPRVGEYIVINLAQDGDRPVGWVSIEAPNVKPWSDEVR